MSYAMVRVTDVKVSEDRQRKGLGKDTKKAQVAFDDLKASIQRTGLINPIRVDSPEGMNLLAGFRRLQAFMQLGIEEIPATFGMKEDSPLERQLLELDENIQRLDLEWHEREEAIAKIDRIRTQQDPSWTQTKTAAQVGTSQSKVSEAHMLTKMMELFPEIKKADTRTKAVSMAKQKAKTTIRAVEVKQNPQVYKDAIEKIACADSSIYITSMADGSAGRLILTDPPFGINYDKRPAGDGPHESYSDTPEEYRELVTKMAPHLYRVLPNDGFLVWFLAHDHVGFVKEQFAAAGFNVDPVPLVWDRSEGKTYSVRPDRWFGKGYDIALHCIKGNPELVVRSRKGGNVFRYKPLNPAEKEHIVERPIELYQEIIRCMTIPGEKVTDFFGGSGKVAAAAASLGRDHFTVEMNKNHIPTIIMNISNHTPTVEEKQA